MKKTVPRLLLSPITTRENSAINQLRFLEFTRNLLKARGKSHLQSVIDFGFASRWLKIKNWRENFSSIIKRSNCNHIITVDSHLKIAVMHLILL